jgi:TetR/AcrR family transcriptional regulator, regulator of mycofactocin system
MADRNGSAQLGRKRDATRRRLLDAANELFREQGYERTTAAAIAGRAGVTERTFFRYFPSKADVLVTNWQLGSDALRATLATSTHTNVVEVVRDGLLAFADQLAIDVESAVQLYLDAAAFVPIVQTLLILEQDLADEIARRAGRSSEDRHVRFVAYASLGLLRASVRAFVVDPTGPSLTDMINDGMPELARLYMALQSNNRPPTKQATRKPRRRVQTTG